MYVILCDKSAGVTAPGVFGCVLCCDLVYRLCLTKAAGCVIALIVCCVPGVLVVAGAPVIVSRALCQVCVASEVCSADEIYGATVFPGVSARC